MPRRFKPGVWFLLCCSISSAIYASAADVSEEEECSADSIPRFRSLRPALWRSDDVAGWLSSIGLPQLKPRFKQYGITGRRLLQLLGPRSTGLNWLVEDALLPRLKREAASLAWRERRERRRGGERGGGRGARTSHDRASGRREAEGEYEDEEGGGGEEEEGASVVRVFLVGQNTYFNSSSSSPSSALSSLSSEAAPAVPAATVPLHLVPDFASLLARVPQALARPVSHLLSATGDSLSHHTPIPSKVFAMLPNELFVYPVERNGFLQTVSLPSFNMHVTLKTLSVSPRVLSAAALLSPEECKTLINIAATRMRNSTIAQPGEVGEGRMEVEAARNSRTAWIYPAMHPLVGRIGQRVAELLRVPLSLSEDMQVLHYEPGQHYWAHHDYFDPRKHKGFIASPGRNRFITVLLYLSDVEEGGETVFPLADSDRDIASIADFSDCSHGLKVAPRAGDALVFYNLHPHMQQTVCPDDDQGCQLDVRSLHAGCDVVRGEKWAANYWFHNHL